MRRAQLGLFERFQRSLSDDVCAGARARATRHTNRFSNQSVILVLGRFRPPMPLKPGNPKTASCGADTARDPLTPSERSRQMALVTSRDTKPERAVRQALRLLGVRYRVNSKSLPGTPDIVLAPIRKVIFVHGCFWHRHRGCPRTRLPKTRVAFWSNKFDQNVARDRAARTKLTKSGWKTLVLWECDTEKPALLIRRLRRFLDGAA